MKRKFAALLATVLVMTMGATTVFAAVSPSVAGAVETIESATIEVGTSGTTATTAPVATAVKDTAATTAKAEMDKISNVETAKVAVLTDLTLTDSTGATLSGALTTPVTVTLPVAGVTTGMGVKVLNYYDSAWHEVEAKISADGKVEAKFTHLSPVMVITYTVASGSGSGSGSGSSATDDTPVSPKTGVFPIAAMAAGICLAGAAVCGKKVKFN